jgi:hypothetical protein
MQFRLISVEPITEDQMFQFPPEVFRPGIQSEIVIDNRYVYTQ